MGKSQKLGTTVKRGFTPVGLVSSVIAVTLLARGLSLAISARYSMLSTVYFDLLVFIMLLLPVLYFTVYRPAATSQFNIRQSNGEFTLEVNSKPTIQVQTGNSVVPINSTEQTYKEIVQSMAVGVAVINQKMELVVTNSRLMQRFPNLNLKEKPICYKALRFRDGECEDCPCLKTFKDGLPHETIKQLEFGTAVRTLRIMSSPVKNDAGETVAVTEITEDITELKRVEEEMQKDNQYLKVRVEENAFQLTAAENRYRSLIKHSSEGIFVYNPLTLQIEEANDQFLLILGYTEQEITKLTLPDIICADYETIISKVDRVLNKGEIICETRKYRRKSGSIVDVEVSVCLVDDGQTKVCLVNVRDITERIKSNETLKISFENLKKTMDATVNALVTVTEKRDPYTAGHQHRVAQLASAIAKELGLADETIESIAIAGKLHDIGKIYIPTDILNKPGPLSEVEMSLIRAHPVVSYEILESIPFAGPVANIVAQHHERINGSGYPKGLSGSDLLLESNILAVADVVEAMASHRPYRPAIGLNEALKEISQNGGLLYDPVVVDACLRTFASSHFDFT